MIGRGNPVYVRSILMVAVLGMLGCTLHAGAVSANSYYEGKTIRILVSSSPGAGTDAAGRMAATFLPRYIPGHPKTFVTNMTGAGGLIAANYFTRKAKADGLTLLNTSSSVLGLFKRGGHQVKYDPRNFRALGSISRAGSILAVRKEAWPRLMDRQAKPVVVGDTDGIRTWVAMTVWGAEYLGWNLRWLYGYTGGGELALAFRQGEIEMWATASVENIADLIKDGVAKPIAVSGDRRRQDFADIPTFEELLGDKRPSGAAWDAYLAWAGDRQVDKFIVAPEGTPDDIVAVVRDAFQKMSRDPEFISQANQWFGKGWHVRTGQETELLIRKVTTVSKEAWGVLRSFRKKYGLPTG